MVSFSVSTHGKVKWMKICLCPHCSSQLCMCSYLYTKGIKVWLCSFIWCLCLRLGLFPTLEVRLTYWFPVSSKTFNLFVDCFKIPSALSLLIFFLDRSLSFFPDSCLGKLAFCLCACTRMSSIVLMRTYSMWSCCLFLLYVCLRRRQSNWRGEEPEIVSVFFIHLLSALQCDVSP